MKKAISLIITFVLLISTISAVSLNSYADNNIIGDYATWTAHADTFGGGNDFFHLAEHSTSSILTGTNSTTGAISFTTSNVGNIYYWFPTVTVHSPYELTFDENDEISVSFYLNSDMFFGDANGYNGSVSLGFYWGNYEFCGENQKFTALPDNLNYINNSRNAHTYWAIDEHQNYLYPEYTYREAGPIGAGIYEAGDYGISIDLYPQGGVGVSNTHAGTRIVTDYKITNLIDSRFQYYNENPYYYDNNDDLANLFERFTGTLNNSLDLSNEVTVKITRLTVGYDKYFVVSINNTPIKVLTAYWGTDLCDNLGDKMRFSMNVTGSSDLVTQQFSPASFTLTEINNIPAGVYPSNCGHIINTTNRLGNISGLAYTSDNIDTIEFLIAEYDAMSDTQKQWYADLGEYPTYLAMVDWYDNIPTT